MANVTRNVRVLSNPRLPLLALCVGAGVFAAAMIRTFLPYPAIDVLPLLLAFVIGVYGLGAWLFQKRQLRREGRRSRSARVDDTGLFVDGRPVFRREAIRSIEWCPNPHPEKIPGSAHVRIAGRFRFTMLACESESDARALVDALKAPPRSGPSVFVGFPKWLLFPTKVYVILLVTLFVCVNTMDVFRAPSGLLDPVSWLIIAISLPSLLATASAFHVNVGVDGIEIRKFGSHRFFTFSEIESIERVDSHVVFKPFGGAEERWYFTTGRFRSHPDAARTRAFVERFEEAKAHATTKGVPAISFSGSARDGAASYRRAEYPADVLLRVVEDGHQDLHVRIDAARALRSRIAEVDRDKLRELAGSTVSPELRERLEELAHDDVVADDSDLVAAKHTST